MSGGMSRVRTIRVAFVALAVVFFGTPIAAGFLGVAAEPFENRRLADLPSVSQGWGAFGEASRYLTDHMALRKQAVQANTRIWVDVLGSTPRYAARTPDNALPFVGAVKAAKRQGGAGLQGASARVGNGDWEFIEIEFRLACDARFSNELLLDRWGRLVRELRDDGLETSLFVVPEKASVYPEHLPDEYPYDHCALARKKRFWRDLAEDGPRRGVHEVRSALLRLKADAGDRLFQKVDFHWTTLGALTVVEAVLQRLGRDVRFERSDVVARESSTGRRSMEYDIERPQDAPKIPGRTLLVCDSFVYKWMRLFRPYFEHVSYVSLYRDPEEIAQAIRRSDRVILEAEEVNFKTFAGQNRSVQRLLRELRADDAA